MTLSTRMKRQGKAEVVVVLLAALALGGPIPRRAQAQEKANAIDATSTTARELPSGEEVLNRHIAKTGGQEAYDKIKNRVSESTLEIVGQGVSLEITTYAARPNKSLVKIDSELTGKIEKGCDGMVVWENSLISGPVIHDGAQRSTGLRDSTFERFVHWKTIYESADCTSVMKVNDSDCYEIVLTPKKLDSSGDENPMRLFIDVDSYLIRKIQTIVASEAGQIPVVAFPEDYRQVDGIMVAHKLRMELLGQKREFTINSVKHNVDLPEGFFDLPDEVQQLIK